MPLGSSQLPVMTALAPLSLIPNTNVPALFGTGTIWTNVPFATSIAIAHDPASPAVAAATAALTSGVKTRA